MLGCVGHEDAPDEKARLAVLQHGLGEREEVLCIFNDLWRKLQHDGSLGCVTLDDLQRFLIDQFPSKVLRPQIEKVMNCLLDKNREGYMGTIGLPHILRLIWPGSTSAELQRMLQFVDDVLLDEQSHVPEPPVLSKDDYKALCTTFNHLNKRGEGKGIKFATLVHERLCDADQAEQYRSDFGFDRDDDISLGVFLIMMCPVGFRAFKGAVVGTNEKDDWLTLISDGIWQLAGPPKNIPGLRDIQPDLPSNAELDLAELDLELLD